jgi:hypothetical protein
VEGWIYRREDQRKDSDVKFDARGEPCIFVGYPSNQHSNLVWCPARGSNAVVATPNVTFWRSLPRATPLGNEVISGSDEEIALLDRPTALVVEDVHRVADQARLPDCWHFPSVAGLA